MQAEDLINFRALSRLLTGSPTKMHSKFIPKDHKEGVDKLKTVINYWLEDKTVVSEDEINAILSEFLIFIKVKLKEKT